jgi:class 3 adenylate cyclase
MNVLQMKSIRNNIINIGVDANVSPSEVKYITLINVLSLVGGVFFVLGFVFVFVWYLPESAVYLFQGVMCVLLFPMVLLFNRFKLYLFARIYFNVLGIVTFVTVSLLGGYETNTHLFLVLVIIAAFFIYPPREKAFMYGILFLTLASFLGLEVWFFSHESVLGPSPRFVKAMTLNFNIGLVVYVSGFSFYVHKIYFRAEHKLEAERRRSERLLHNILPIKVADRLKTKCETIADGFSECSVLFADIEGFTRFSRSVHPEGLVAVLNEIFSRFDDLVDKHNLEKIKTIGDAYMVVAGLPEPRHDHAEAIAAFALEMHHVLRRYHDEKSWDLKVRIGIDSGPVIAGVIGKKKFIYDLWGDTVNTASRMESHGLPGEIQVTKSTYKLLKDRYELRERGYLHIKGKGKMQTYLLKGGMEQQSVS